MKPVPSKKPFASFLSRPAATPVLSALVASFLTVAGALAQQAGKSPVKIFVLAGQSNMVGQGSVSPVTTPGTLESIVANDPGGERQFLVDGGGDWIVRDDVWISFGNKRGGLTKGYGSASTTMGPELGFGHLIGDLYEEQVLIIKAAWGGKSLGNDFLPPSSGSNPATAADKEPGHYYQRVLDAVSAATSNLATYFPDYDGNGYEIAGFFWHQGWNDRINETFSAAYETNMANFIRDMRDDLGAPDMPFVIATTGMDGSPTYREIELAQLAMANPATHPEFDGNVAVVDTRGGYEGMSFWRQPYQSPKEEGYHWNKNAETYLNIGLAGADAMSLLAPGRCPYRLRAVGAPGGGVTLSWQNGTETPTSVRILRDGIELVAALPGSTTTYLDSGVLPGVYDYELQFTMPGDPCDPLTFEFNGGITGLELDQTTGDFVLTWDNAMTYTNIEVRRNGSLLATLPGTVSTYTDASPPTSGVVNYSVVPTDGSTTPATIEINLDITGQLGVLDLGANGGINPSTGVPWQVGDSYRLVFTTSATTNATATDIATYNAFVQGVAAASTTFPKLGDTVWKAIGSTGTINAKVNTGTDGAGGVPFFLTDGSTVFAYNNLDLWNGANADASGDYIAINLDENGASASASGELWTGSKNNGTASDSRYLGATEDASGDTFLVATGVVSTAKPSWLGHYSRQANSARPMYAMSAELVVVNGLDSTAPVLQSIDDNVSGGPAIANLPVMFTVTFSEAMNAATVGVDDFGNAAASPASVTINSVSATANPAVFEVVVTPSSTGDIQLGLAPGALLKDLAGNLLDVGVSNPDDTIIEVSPDSTPPDLLSIVDDVSGGPVFADNPVTFTLTFSEAMIAATIGTNDFENGSDAPVTIDSVSPTADPAVFQVVVTPTGAGSLQLRVKAGAGLQDLYTNPLNTTAALPDDTTITVRPSLGLAGELGILDVTANDGINPATGVTWQEGDTYRLIFVTSTGTPATSTDIGTYNGFVQGVAAASTTYSNLSNVTWKAVGSTGSVNARENTGATDLGGGSPVFFLDGTTLFATDNAALWSLSSGSASSILNENGVTYAGEVWTGTQLSGLAQLTRYLGATIDTNDDGKTYLVTVGNTGSNWLAQYSRRNSGKNPVYALSQPLTIVPADDGGGGPVDPTYTTWANTHAPGQDPDQDFDQDFDLDGVANGLEFVLGGTKDSKDLGKLPAAFKDGTHMTFTFQRAQASIGGVAVTIEVGNGLDDWPTGYSVPDGAAASVPGVTVLKDSSPGFDAVTLTLPMDSAKKFARLKVVPTL